MDQDPSLDDAYALRSSHQVRALYARWASSYDSAFHEAQGYQLPREVVHAFAVSGGGGPILDVGAGTGLVGEGLKALRLGPIDALDLSDDMLNVARMKSVYRDHIAADLLDLPEGIAAGSYHGIVSAGTFTLGHVGPEGLGPLLSLGAAGAVFVVSVNEAHYDSAGFAGAMEHFAPHITGRQDKLVRIYDDRANASHRNDVARLMMFRKV